MKLRQNKPIPSVSRKSPRALALVCALWLSAAMTAMVSIVAQTVLVDSKASQYENEKQRCRWAARAGLETAAALLLDDDRAADGLVELWAEPAALALELDGVNVQIEIVDACGKIDMNTADANQLLMLPDMTEEIVDSIQDWLDSDDQPRPGGAESGYYLNLDYGYLPRNGRLRTMPEMLRIKGVLESFYYGDAALGPLSADNAGWREYLTCWSRSPNVDSNQQARVNVNRANMSALQQVGFTEPQARWIVENRPFQRLAELAGKQEGRTSSTTPPSSTQPRQMPAAPQTDAGRQTTPLQPQQRPTLPQSDAREQMALPTAATPPPNQQIAQPGQQNRPPQTNVPTGQQEKPPSTPPDWQTVLRLIDRLTLTNRSWIRGQLNVNTASVEVLTAFFEGNRQLAEQIIAARETRGGMFLDLSELADVPQMTEAILKQYIDRLTVRSSMFEITVTATSAATGQTMRLETVLNRDRSEGQVSYWKQYE